MTQDNASPIANVDPVSAQGADSCLTCVYWKTDTSDTTSGECRIDRPVVLALSDTIVTVFPRTGDSEWCGSHEGVDDGEDDDDEQDDKPTYEELEAMLQGSLVACKRLQANLADIGDLVISDPAKCKRAHRSMPRPVFHKIMDRDRELLASVFANFKVREEAKAEFLAEAEADELLEDFNRAVDKKD